VRCVYVDSTGQPRDDCAVPPTSFWIRKTKNKNSMDFFQTMARCPAHAPATERMHFSWAGPFPSEEDLVAWRVHES
jgi:hypothetical protein